MKTNVKKDAKRLIDFVNSVEPSGCFYTFGNGGSASIAEHMACDWMKGTDSKWVVVSLSSNGPLLSAIGNDMGYEYTCLAQLRWLPKAHFVVLISSSGNSPNIVKAAQWVKKSGMKLIGFSGFGGGKLKELSDCSISIDSTDYGVCEDYHSNVMHEVLSQLRAKARKSKGITCDRQ
jgi:phosphoheptose isomerase